MTKMNEQKNYKTNTKKDTNYLIQEYCFYYRVNDKTTRLNFPFPVEDRILLLL